MERFATCSAYDGGHAMPAAPPDDCLVVESGLSCEQGAEQQRSITVLSGDITETNSAEFADRRQFASVVCC